MLMILTLLNKLLLLCVGSNKVESKALETKIYRGLLDQAHDRV
jgi:hypothetical protein